MSCPSLTRKCGSTIHSLLTFVVFLFFDLLETLLCFVYRFLDEYFEAKPCFCQCGRNGNGDGDVSETLFTRRNVFAETGVSAFLRKIEFSKKMEFIGFSRNGKVGRLVNRWSDCGCEGCVSWVEKGDDKLHVVVKEPLYQGKHEISEGNRTENVIFVHGFLSSSSIWTQTVFQNLPKHIKSNHRLFAVDLLGFGKSPKPNDSFYTLRDHVEMIEKSVIFQSQIESFHVVGHSMGCIVALALAAKYSKIVKSVVLVAPPYYSSSEASLGVLEVVAEKKLWPPVAFGISIMSWYEHIGRSLCFFVCRHHQTWEKIIKLLTGKRDLHFMITDFTRHTHRSAWHSMHNVICGGAKFTDEYLKTLIDSRVKVCVVQGDRDPIVPLTCCNTMKAKFPDVEVNVIPNADHQNVVIHEDFVHRLERIWTASNKFGLDN